MYAFEQVFLSHVGLLWILSLQHIVLLACYTFHYAVSCMLMKYREVHPLITSLKLFDQSFQMGSLRLEVFGIPHKRCIYSLHLGLWHRQKDELVLTSTWCCCLAGFSEESGLCVCGGGGYETQEDELRSFIQGQWLLSWHSCKATLAGPLRTIESWKWE